MTSADQLRRSCCVFVKAEAAEAEQQRRAMAEQVASAAAEVAAVTMKAQEATATAQAQAAANKELMLRKTNIEWQLIQALSSSESPKVPSTFLNTLFGSLQVI